MSGESAPPTSEFLFNWLSTSTKPTYVSTADPKLNHRLSRGSGEMNILPKRKQPSLPLINIWIICGRKCVSVYSLHSCQR